jgi:streptomycin 6-kinase
MRSMDVLNQNIKNIYAEKGEAWIADLQKVVSSLAQIWDLKYITPVDNMTFNYVAKAFTCENNSVVLKISCDAKTIEDEKKALMYFAGDGSVKLLDYNEEHHALLLEQAVPGYSLKTIYELQPDYVMDSYIQTMNKLHTKSISHNNEFSHLKDWLVAIDRLPSSYACSSQLVQKAIALKNELLSTMGNEKLLHGDLHHDNILQSGDHWIAIDPKGVIGEPEFEIAAFDFMNIDELANVSDVKLILESRIAALAQKAQLDAQRIKDWVFVRLMLLIAWQVEDNADPSWAIKLAERLI